MASPYLENAEEKIRNRETAAIIPTSAKLPRRTGMERNRPQLGDSGRMVYNSSVSANAHIDCGSRLPGRLRHPGLFGRRTNAVRY
jgi:hypothetical protein